VDQLGLREAAVVRTHLQGCYPNLTQLPDTIGELLYHLNVRVVGSGSAEVDTEIARALAAPRPVVLVVDGDHATRAEVAAQLAGAGYAAATAADAVDALRQLHGGLRPCVIIVDLRLPRVTGSQLMSWLAGHATYARIPVVALCADVSTSMRGATRVEIHGKPLDHAAVIAAVERHCGAIAARQTTAEFEP
jgi:CheY-like chemotaxis protein